MWLRFTRAVMALCIIQIILPLAIFKYWTRPEYTIQDCQKQKKNADLQYRLDALINEARLVANYLGIETESDMYSRKNLDDCEGVIDWIVDDASRNTSDEVKNFRQSFRPAPRPVCEHDNDCSHRGVCDSGRCRCVASYVGKYCGHSIMLDFGSGGRSRKISRVGWPGSFVKRMLEEEDLSDYQNHGDTVLHQPISQATNYDSCSVLFCDNDRSWHRNSVGITSCTRLKCSAITSDGKENIETVVVNLDAVAAKTNRLAVSKELFNLCNNCNSIVIRDQALHYDNHNWSPDPLLKIFNDTDLPISIPDPLFEAHVMSFHSICSKTGETQSSLLFSILYAINISPDVFFRDSINCLVMPSSKLENDTVESDSSIHDHICDCTNLKFFRSAKLIQVSDTKPQ